MKKLTMRTLCLGLVLVALLGLSACGGSGEEAVTSLGTWELTDLGFMTIEQGKLANAFNTVVTIYSDNTYMVSVGYNSFYSSDGGETYNPTFYNGGSLYGTYEVTSEDAELGERSIKFTSVTRIVANGLDTDVSVSDSDKDTYLTNSGLIGQEVYLTSDGRVSEIIDHMLIYGLGAE